MDQRIEPPNAADTESLARQLAHAHQLVLAASGRRLTGGVDDLGYLQITIDSGTISADQTYALQSLGVALGRVFVENTPHYDWWMVQDEYGRDPALRFKETTLLAFPQTMLSKRIEDGESVDVPGLYQGLSEQLEQVRAQNYPAT